MNHKEMWKKIFGDTDEYVDFYFKEKATRSIVYSKYMGDDLVSMAFFTPCRVYYRGELCRCPYIVGVATLPEHRGNGYMKNLLEQGLIDAGISGAPVAFLSPVKKEIYEPLGFESVYYRNEIEIAGGQKAWYKVTDFARLDEKGKREAAEYAKAQLYMSNLDLYMCHDVEYYDRLRKEVKALGGKVVVIREGKMIRGVAAYTKEAEKYEVIEVICDPDDGQKVMESLCAHLTQDEEETILFGDSYFLGNVSGEKICIRRKDEPYLMLKRLGEEMQDDEPVGSLRVYINDIT